MNQVDYKRFYSELGKLLYAAADVNKVITPAEKKELQEIVKKELVPAESNTDEYGTPVPYYAEIEFEYLDEQIIDSETALQSFLTYIDDHRRLIDERMRRTCLKLAERLARAYHGVSTKEQALLSEIKHKLVA